MILCLGLATAGCDPLFRFGYQLLMVTAGCAPLFRFGYQLLMVTAGCDPLFRFDFQLLMVTAGCGPLFRFGYQLLMVTAGCDLLTGLLLFTSSMLFCRSAYLTQEGLTGPLHPLNVSLQLHSYST